MDDIDVDEAHSYGDFDVLPDALRARLVSRPGPIVGRVDRAVQDAA
jgi:hypothetical protein